MSRQGGNMTLSDIVFKNLMRRKARAIFVLAGIVIAVATVVSLRSFTVFMTNDISEKIDKYGANILIVPKTDNLSLSYGGVNLGGISFEMHELNEHELSRVKTIPNAQNIAAVGPMVLGAVVLQDHHVLLAGVDFTMSKVLKPWWNIDGSLPAETGALLGAEVAQLLGLNNGEHFSIKGRKLEVAGIIRPTGSQDDQLIFVNLQTAQDILSKHGVISMAEVAALCNACPIDEMVRQISEVLPGAKVMAIQQVVKSRMETLGLFNQFSLGISAVIILVGGLVVFVTMMGSVRERTLEIGILRAIGFKKKHIIHIIMLEVFVLSALAGITGYISGIGATRIALGIIIQGRTIIFGIEPALAIQAVTGAILIGLCASIYPSLMAARLDPNEALRSL